MRTTLRTTVRTVIAVAVLLSSTQLFGASFATSSRLVREFPIDPAGSVWIDNPFGSIDVVGGDGNVISVTADRTLTAPDTVTLKEASDAVTLSFEGDTKVRLIRTLLPPMRNVRWVVAVNYVVRVPRGVNVKIGGSKSAEHIRVSNVNGSVTINGFSGTVIMEGVVGASVVNMVNGRIIYDYTQKPVSRAQVQAVNADIDIWLPANSNFEWIANTINGDMLSTFNVKAGRFTGSVFHGAVGSGGITINTESMMGHVAILAKGSSLADAQSIRMNDPAHPAGPGDVLRQPAKKIQMPFVNGDFVFAASVADVVVGEVRGNARVETGAGEVELGAVFGQCNVTSLGGPLNLGDIMGSLFAHTGAGDIIVRAARMGGQVTTDGGLVRVIYAGGRMTLRSGGGDIIVRQFSSFMDAETSSGDVTLTADPAQKTIKAIARTLQGNIILNVSPRFAADIDATILTSDPDVNEMHIDFNGISIRREQVGNKTRIRATGKINGGGERIELYAEEGDIHISAQNVTPIRLANPK
jgi:DUF4097 and DUF4098 domain-containing protein YvlB